MLTMKTDGSVVKIKRKNLHTAKKTFCFLFIQLFLILAPAFSSTPAAAQQVDANPETQDSSSVLQSGTVIITFDAGGGAPCGEEKIVTVGTPYGALPTAEKENYDFVGWETEDAVSVQENTIVTSGENHMLTAIWRPSSQAAIAYTADTAVSLKSAVERTGPEEATVITLTAPSGTDYYLSEITGTKILEIDFRARTDTVLTIRAETPVKIYAAQGQRHLQLIGDGTLILENIILDGGSIPYTGGIDVPGGTITISGRGQASIQNNDSPRRDAIYNGVQSADSYLGGGIYASDSSLTLSGTLKINNNTAKSCGGAICTTNGALYIMDAVEISENEAIMSDPVGGQSASYASAIFAYASNVFISGNTSITGNKALPHAAATYSYVTAAVYVQQGTLTITDNVKINDNISSGLASPGGGGISVYHGGQLIIHGDANGSGVEICNNSAPRGGGIFINSGINTISGNVKINHNRSTAGQGGGVWSGNLVTISGSVEIAENTASSLYTSWGPGYEAYGGGVFQDVNALTISEEVSIHDNTAEKGGGVYAVGRPGENDTLLVTITDSVNIQQNTAKDEGGGVYVERGGVKIYGTASSYPSIIKNAAREGGGVYANNGEVIITENVEIHENYTQANDGAEAGNGGGVYVKDGNTTISRNSKIVDNTAKNGGGLYLEAGMATLSNNLETNVTVSENHATRDGGGIYIVQTALTVTGNLIVKNNSALGDTGAGGGIYAQSMTLTLEGTLLVSDNSAFNGAGIYAKAIDLVRQNDSHLAVRNNTAALFGGGIFFTNGIGRITSEVDILENQALLGAGLYITNGEMTMTAAGEIRANQAVGSGGGVYVGESGIFTMAAGSLTENTAQRNGAGVYVGSAGTFNITGGTITSNNAGYDAHGSILPPGEDLGNGGGVFVGTSGEFYITGGTIDANKAHYGGGIYLKQGEKADIKNADITNNAALYNGGGIWTLPAENVDADEDVIFSGNTAQSLYTWDLFGIYGAGSFEKQLQQWHQTHIQAATFSAGMNNAYNNYDMSTAGPLSSIRIYYVDEYGTLIATTKFEALTFGASYQAIGPDILGYTPIGHQKLQEPFVEGTVPTVTSGTSVAYADVTSNLYLCFVYKEGHHLNLSVPVKLLWAAFEENEGTIVSPTYQVINHSPQVTVAIQATLTNDTYYDPDGTLDSDISLILVGISQTADGRPVTPITPTDALAFNESHTLGNIDAGERLGFQIGGTYAGIIPESSLHPVYGMSFRFSLVEVPDEF